MTAGQKVASENQEYIAFIEFRSNSETSHWRVRVCNTLNHLII